MKQLSILVSAAVLGLSAYASGQSAFTVNFNFAGMPGDQFTTAGDSSSALVSGAIVDRGPGIFPAGAMNSISSNGWDSPDPSQDYFSIRFEVDPGYFVTLDNLLIGSRSSNTGPGVLALRYNGDGFGTDLAVLNQDGNFKNDNIDLSVLPDLTGMVEFRIVATADVRANGDPDIGAGGTFRLTNYFDGVDTGGLTFGGTVSVIPEPSTYALLAGILGLAVVVFRRRRA
ncbi:MAG: PEP-CTERM sorting domain-containing protein [Opitutales bacterium]|nr:PEP-CTERM sorting domain-containing protein [Opitutales bacterium]